ncbi:MAG: hypothetical protein JWP08_809 [Bryobacterales bacterium]|nr:hypothetical protein [Bryobacterales bacterium]
MVSSTRQGMAPCRGIAEVFSGVVFFFIFVAAMHGGKFQDKLGL